MSQVFERGPSTPRMNMTPMIDVVFQLIIFFMLVNTIASEEILPIVLPKLDDPQTRKLGEVERVIINLGTSSFEKREPGVEGLSTSGELTRVKVGMRLLDPKDTNLITDLLVQARTQNPNVQVLLRADSALYFEEVQPVMRAITAAQIKKVNMVAYMEDDI